MLVLMVMLGAGFGWLGMKLKQAREQRKAVEAIERLGGWAGCEPRSSGALRTVAAWLITSVGEDLSLDVVAVYLGKDSDAGVPNLGGVTQLYGLSVDCAQVTDAWLERLRGLSQVRCLWLNGTQVTDAGLIHLHGMTELRGLILDDTQVTDSGLAHLRGPTQLQWLLLHKTQVTDAGVAELKKVLPNTQISRAPLTRKAK